MATPILAAALGCGHGTTKEHHGATAAHHGATAGHHPSGPVRPDSALERVAAIHGGTGPFAVAGYRMGERALRELGAERGSFDLEVVHESPPRVQWSCIADGLQAATGTSPGRLNLKLVEVSRDRASSVVRNRRTGKAVTFTLTPAFLDRWKDLPSDQNAAAGAEVMRLADHEIFEITLAS